MQIRDVSVEWFNPKTKQVETVTFKLAPTPMWRLAEQRPHFGGANVDTPEGLRALIAAIYYGAIRAGSQITLQWLEDNVDFYNCTALFEVFGELNGVKFTGGKIPKAAEANGAAGEPVAAGSNSSTTSPSLPPT